MEFGILLHPFRRPVFQLIDKERMRVRPLGVTRRGHFVVGQAILERAFAVFRQVGEGGNNHIRGHAVQLRGTAGHAIKFLDGELERAIVLRAAAQKRSKPANLQDGLHRSFAESVLVAHDHGPAVILQGGRENLTGRGALPAGQHHQRTRVGDAGIGIIRDHDISIGPLGLHNRARLKK